MIKEILSLVNLSHILNFINPFADGIAGLRAKPERGGKSPCLKVRPDGELSEMATKALTLYCREKLLKRPPAPVPETDTGGLAEETKVSEKTIVKELCKLTP